MQILTFSWRISKEIFETSCCRLSRWMLASVKRLNSDKNVALTTQNMSQQWEASEEGDYRTLDAVNSPRCQREYLGQRVGWSKDVETAAFGLEW